MKKPLLGLILILLTVGLALQILRGFADKSGRIALPSSKLLLEPVPGDPQTTNSFPTSMALSPDGKYLALLNNGYGTFESDYKQSIAILDIASNKLTDFHDARLERHAHQTYFYGLAFSSDGKKLYASMSSMTDPEGKNPSNNGSGIATYDFADGRVTPAGFIRFPASARAAAPKTAPEDPDEEPSAGPGFTVPFPTGITSFQQQGKEMLLVADNLSDAAEIVVPTSQEIRRVELAAYRAVPGSYPFATLVTKDGNTGYVSLWNASRVAEIDLGSGKLKRMIELHAPAKPERAGSHPTALLLSPDQTRLYVALANTDEVAVIERPSGNVFYLSAKLPEQRYGGNFPIALAITPDPVPI